MAVFIHTGGSPPASINTLSIWPMRDAPLVIRSRRRILAILVRKITRSATAKVRGDRLKYSTDRCNSLVLTTNPDFLAIDGWTRSLQSPSSAASNGIPSTERPAALPPL